MIGGYTEELADIEFERAISVFKIVKHVSLIQHEGISAGVSCDGSSS